MSPHGTSFRMEAGPWVVELRKVCRSPGAKSNRFIQLWSICHCLLLLKSRKRMSSVVLLKGQHLISNIRIGLILVSVYSGAILCKVWVSWPCCRPSAPMVI